MTETVEAIKIQRGLKGVYFDRSPCTFIDGKAGGPRYRGYSIYDLAAPSNFQGTTWPSLNRGMPTKPPLDTFASCFYASTKPPGHGPRHYPGHQAGAPHGCPAYGGIGSLCV